ncbi:glutamate receptor ionotropic, NMDA 2A [Platysternon megacephalum]|uniref:Glutamate receptor ionotropic, NMDA 2A n=1 Tax=Platysternon megacephalum TaxID=55544 RepID=A0A4D9DTJ7_9SAUR|nr:glutamate receptor ionotropic, NMDA 2A [Platysternon megacephalum]
MGKIKYSPMVLSQSGLPGVESLGSAQAPPEGNQQYSLERAEGARSHGEAQVAEVSLERVREAAESGGISQLGRAGSSLLRQEVHSQDQGWSVPCWREDFCV